MPALTSLLEEHRQAISSALSTEFKSTFASLETKLDAVRTTVTDFGERIEILETNASSTEECIQALETSCSTLTEACARLRAKNSDLEGRSRRNNVRRRNDLKYQGTPIRIYEDYSPDVLEQRAAYREVMAKLYNLGLRPALLYPARLQITDRDGNKRRFSSAGEAATFVRSWSAS
ncbi:hypothetical protein SKAU_G00234540 [Synaphobranchus kaupii]|uniref:Transposase element L1Md-A101/L1Md-A102/L1Md-A2 n=1 Tax=Synaphobranchus kaupii TaxID=118154 RepID=A0A9Q1F6C7_SYNKA|nr:hypothetical protein SKAU_G00234540 [Synaphobranchus kaupii]